MTLLQSCNPKALVAMVTSSPIVNDQYQSISSSTDLPKYAAFYVAYVDCSHQCTSGQGRNKCSRDSHRECRGYPVRKDTKIIIKRENIAGPCTEEIEKAI